ncbi:MAG: thioredoxin domain-containing protein, partial [Saprospiraceae bacterium]|nr:thioredoxin domain-containing protein [Saprospiraceae bacterium]
MNTFNTTRTSLRYVAMVFAVLMACGTAAQGIDFRHEGWEEIKADAARQDKIIFVDAYTTWCGPCKWMSAEVFTDAE